MDDKTMIMSNEDRKIFWDTLCKLDGIDPEKDKSILRNKIKFPNLLFRFRPVSINTLEALRTNTMFLSTSNYYDDPFDTFLRINLSAIVKEIDSYFKDNSKLELYIDKFKEFAKNDLNDFLGINTFEELNMDSIGELLNTGVCSKFLKEFSELRHEIKKNTWSVCFSEDGYNESLWIKYADQHKGFAVMYNTLEMDSKLLCGKEYKCNNCGIKQHGIELYPIYYSDEKYDATRFAQFIFLKKIEPFVPIPDFFAPIYTSLGNVTWEREKTILIKKKCHEYDKEWRIVSGANFNQTAHIEWIPNAIILGLNIGVSEENLVVTTAIQAGIDKIYRAIIDQSGDLGYQLIWERPLGFSAL